MRVHDFEALERYWAECLADIAALEAALTVDDTQDTVNHPLFAVIAVIKNHTMEQVISAIEVGMDTMSLAFSVREHRRLLQTLAIEPTNYTDFIAKSLHYLKYLQMFDQTKVAMITDKIGRYDPLIRRYVDYKVASVDLNTSVDERTKLRQDWSLVLDEYVRAVIADDYHVTHDNQDTRTLMRTSLINALNEWYEPLSHQDPEVFRRGLIDCKDFFYDVLPTITASIIHVYREISDGTGACKHLAQLLVSDANMGSNRASDWLKVQLMERFVQCDQRRMIQDMQAVCWQLSFCDDLALLNQDQRILLCDAVAHNVGILRFANAAQGAIQTQSKVFHSESTFGINSLYNTVVHDAFYCFEYLLGTVFHNRLTLDQWTYLLDAAVSYSSYRIIQGLAEVVIDADVQNDINTRRIKDLLLRYVNRKTRNESVALLSKLIEYGASVNARTQPFIGTTGCSLLVIACANGHDDYVRALLAAGADPYDYHVRTDAGATVNGQLPQRADRYSMAMTTVCIYGHSICMQRLLEGVVDPNALLRGNTDTALYLCCTHGSTGCARMLINQGVDVNAKGHFKRTPLLAASEHGHSECCALLIQSGAQLDCRDYKGNTALMMACVKGHVACVSLLLAAGADVNIINGAGKSALMQLCQDSALDAECRDEIVSLLMAKGARNSRGVGCFSFFFTKASRLAESQGYLSTAVIIQNSAR